MAGNKIPAYLFLKAKFVLTQRMLAGFILNSETKFSISRIDFHMKTLLVLFITLFISVEVLAQCDNLKPMYGDKCVKSAKLQKADKDFRELAIKQNGSADSAAKFYLFAGWKYFHGRDAETAMKRFNQAWLLQPENPAVYFAFGHLVRYAFGKNAADSERYYKLGRLRDPNKTAEKNTLLWLIEALENRNEPEAVVDASTQLIVSFPEFGNGFGYKKRAYYYTNLQMPDRAITDYEKAIAIDPKDANSYLGRGYAYSWKRDHQKALADYAKAIELDPKFAGAYANRAILYADSLNQSNQALADIDKALQLQPTEPEFYQIKSNILFKMNRAPEACACLQNGIAAGHKSLETVFKEKCGK